MFHMSNLVETLQTERPQDQRWRSSVYVQVAIIQVGKLRQKKKKPDHLQKSWIDPRHSRETALFKQSPSYLSWWPEWCRNKPSSTEAPRLYGRNQQGGETSASRKAPATWRQTRKQQKQLDQPPRSRSNCRSQLFFWLITLFLKCWKTANPAKLERGTARSEGQRKSMPKARETVQQMTN